MRRSDKSPLHSTWAKLFIAALAATILIVAGTASSRAFDWNHVVSCFGWMIFDPNAHAEQCLPSNIPPDNKSLTTPGTPSVPSDDDDDACNSINCTLTTTTS